MSRVLIIDNGTKHLEAVKNLLSHFEQECIPCDGLYEIDYDPYDLIVLSGNYLGPEILNNEELYLESRLIIESNKPVIGICYGAELICHLYGGKLSRLPQRVSDDIEIKFEYDPIDISKALRERPKVCERHSWAITSLSDKIEGLASSMYGWEIIKVKDRDIIGFQFHPELELETDGNEIFYNLLNYLGLGENNNE